MRFQPTPQTPMRCTDRSMAAAIFRKTSDPPFTIHSRVRTINTPEAVSVGMEQGCCLAYSWSFRCDGTRSIAHEFGSGKSAACGSPLRRAYPPYRRCGRVAEGGGLLNRYRVVKPYRGFESLRLRHPSPIGLRDSGPRKSIPERRYGRTKVRLVDVDTSPRRRFRDAAYMIWC
jgi:hypothetical protein